MSVCVGSRKRWKDAGSRGKRPEESMYMPFISMHFFNRIWSQDLRVEQIPFQ